MTIACPHCHVQDDAPEPKHVLEVVVCDFCGEVYAVVRGKPWVITPRAMEALRRDSHWPSIAADSERVKARAGGVRGRKAWN